MEVTTGTGGKVTARSTCTDAVIQRLVSQPAGGLGGTCRDGPDDGPDVFAAGDVVAVGDPDSARDPGGPADGGKPDAPADAGVPDASRWPLSGTAELHAATASAAASTPAVTGIACPAGRCIVTSIAQSRRIEPPRHERRTGSLISASSHEEAPESAVPSAARHLSRRGQRIRSAWRQAGQAGR